MRDSTFPEARLGSLHALKGIRMTFRALLCHRAMSAAKFSGCLYVPPFKAAELPEGTCQASTLSQHSFHQGAAQAYCTPNSFHSLYSSREEQ